MTASLAVECDHAVNDVSAVHASQGCDSAPSLIDDFGHSQTGTAGAFHSRSLLLVVSCGGLPLSSFLVKSETVCAIRIHILEDKEVAPVACPFSWQEGTSAGRQVREGDAPELRWADMA